MAVWFTLTKSRRRGRVPRLAAWLLVLLLPPLLQTSGHATVPEDDSQAEYLIRSRESYRDIKQEFRGGTVALFLKRREQLRDYPLYPELAYHYLLLRLNREHQEEIDQFLHQYDGLWQARQLRAAWLRHLYQKQQWRMMAAYFRDAEASAELRCQYQHAQFLAGHREQALSEGLALWKAGFSQPNACDPLFQLLIENGRITEAVAWERFVEASRQQNFRLADYLTRFFTSREYREMATNVRMMRREPGTLAQFSDLAQRRPETLDLIGQSLEKLAGQDAPLALRHWQDLRQRYRFDPATESRILQHLVKGLHLQEHPELALDTLNSHLMLASERLLEWQLQALLRAGNWKKVDHWLAGLPAGLTENEQWHYWRARIGMFSDDTPGRHQALLRMRELSGTRSYYGFLASDWTGKPYDMQNRPIAVMDWEIEKLAELPAMRRVQEYLYHQEFISANREWQTATAQLSDAQLLVAAQLAERWRWAYQVIITLARAEYWDDIGLRFPLAYHLHFTDQAKKHDLPAPLMFAVSRQESAFMPFAVSPAGARGLMQLMPGTAREVAQRHGIPYRRSGDLFDPEINIRLGSQYYKNMMQRFDGNRILATAAYNAGPNRVERWLRESNGERPFDVWIETIPFDETRKYVKNVLAYSVIFGHHLGSRDPLLSEREKDKNL